MSTHHGYLNEFPFIRVDNFDNNPNPLTGKMPHFYLLTHAHTDHIRGLDAVGFKGQVYTTAVTKKLIQETMITAYRVRHEETAEQDPQSSRKFRNLSLVKRGGRGEGAGMDKMKVLSLNTPRQVPGPGGDVTITALDANHCPGSAMFLIEGFVRGRFRSCLITGDVRIEPWWLEALKHNPIVAPYIPGETQDGASMPVKTLDCIYLDTSSVLLTDELPTKDEAVAEVIKLIAEYPPDTRFFLNAWTWGYEEMLKGIYKAFGEMIHLDWYKHSLYTSEAFRSCDPLLATLGTMSSYPPSSTATLNPSPSLRADPTANSAKASTSASASTPPRPLRFHACERRWKCDHVWNDGLGCFAWEDDAVKTLKGPKRLKRPGSGEVLPEDRANGGARIVYINPSEMPKWIYEAYREDLDKKIERWKMRQEMERGKGKRRASGDGVEQAELPNTLIIPLARHSSCPELQSLVALFRPLTVYPLTCTDDDPVSPAHQYMTLPSMFGHLLAPGGEKQLRQEAEDYCRKVKRISPSPARQDDALKECGLIEPIEPEWLTKMSLKGLNLEGPFEVVKEVDYWLKRLDKEEWRSSRSPTQARVPLVQRSEPSKTALSNAHAEALFLSDTEDEEMPPPPKKRKTSAAASTAGPALARQLSYGETTSESRQPPALSASVVPPTATASTRRLCTPELAAPVPLDSPLSIVPPLRKSVTFAASPTLCRVDQRRVGASASSSCPTSSCSSSPHPAPSNCASTAVAAPRNTAQPLTSASTTASSASILHPTVARKTHQRTQVEPARLSGTRPSSATREHRHAVVAALQRKMRGLLCEGGSIEPFAAGDPRLQGRRPLSLTAYHGKGKENEVAGRGKGSDGSPSSFRTVSPSTSPLA